MRITEAPCHKLASQTDQARLCAGDPSGNAAQHGQRQAPAERLGPAPALADKHPPPEGVEDHPVDDVAGHVPVGDMLAVAATLVWIVLLLIAPIHALHSWWPHLYKGERAIVGLVSVLLLVFVLSTNGLIYLLQDGAPATFGSVLEAICLQFIQPMMWGNPWAHPNLI